MFSLLLWLTLDSDTQKCRLGWKAINQNKMLLWKEERLEETPPPVGGVILTDWLGCKRQIDNFINPF